MDIPGIQGIDTRALTRRLRKSGAMRACIAMEDVSDEKAVGRAKAVPYEGVDFVQEVTTRSPYDWDTENRAEPKMDSLAERSPAALPATRQGISLKSCLPPRARSSPTISDSRGTSCARCAEMDLPCELSPHPRPPPRSLR